MKTFPVNQISTQISEFFSVPEFLKNVIEYLDNKSLLETRVVCKKFKEQIDLHKFNSLILKSQQYILSPELTAKEYRDYINFIQIAYNNKKILADEFAQLRNTADVAKYNVADKYSQERHTIRKMTANSLFAVTSLALGIVGYSLLPADFLLDTSLWEKCWQKDDMNETKFIFIETDCQEVVDQNLFWFVMSKTALAATLGFIAKTLDHFLAVCIQEDYLTANSSILPRLPLKQPLTMINKLSYGLWCALAYRDIPVLATGLALSGYLKLSNSLHMDISVCSESFNKKTAGHNCLAENLDNILANMSEMVVSQGFMYGFSMLGILYLFYKLLEKTCQSVKNSYQACSFHGFFNSKNSYRRIPTVESNNDVEEALFPTPSLS